MPGLITGMTDVIEDGRFAWLCIALGALRNTSWVTPSVKLMHVIEPGDSPGSAEGQIMQSRRVTTSTSTCALITHLQLVNLPYKYGYGRAVIQLLIYGIPRGA